ncbi:MAG: hypothetical protein H6805_03065 [Planctomycetes bacterium]|nr:PAS domain-containing protein [Planctomycetota bacterium]MCB9824790.1 hypothetical protein [Planctomycetota bacterium]
MDDTPTPPGSRDASGSMARLIVDVDGQIVDADVGATRLLDAPRNDLRGTSLGDWLVHHETRMRTVLQRVGRHLSQTPAPARSTGAWSTLEVRSARGRGRRCIIHLAARDDGLLELSLAPMP